MNLYHSNQMSQHGFFYIVRGLWKSHRAVSCGHVHPGLVLPATVAGGEDRYLPLHSRRWRMDGGGGSSWACRMSTSAAPPPSPSSCVYATSQHLPASSTLPPQFPQCCGSRSRNRWATVRYLRSGHAERTIQHFPVEIECHIASREGPGKEDLLVRSRTYRHVPAVLVHSSAGLILADGAIGHPGHSLRGLLPQSHLQILRQILGHVRVHPPQRLHIRTLRANAYQRVQVGEVLFMCPISTHIIFWHSYVSCVLILQKA
jgi:hypothetical protein